MRLHGSCAVVERVRILGRFPLQLTRVVQRTRATIAEKPVMTDEFYVVAVVAMFDAVHANRISIRRVARAASVKVVHGKAGVAGDFVQALSGADCLVDCVKIVVYFIGFQLWFHSAGKAEAAELVVEHLIELERGGGVVRDFDPRRQTIENTISLERRMTLSGNEDAGLGVAEDVVLL